jgi:prophage maintenance system killer protein
MTAFAADPGLCQSIATKHPLVNGNKRLAFLSRRGSFVEFGADSLCRKRPS